jgi:hypothetical protein
MARTGLYAAAVGSTTAGTSGLLTATGTSRPTATTIPAFAFPELDKTAGWRLFDPTVILSAYDMIYHIQRKEIGPRHVSRIDRMFSESLPGDIFTELTVKLRSYLTLTLTLTRE